MVRMSASGLVATAWEMHIPVPAAGPKLITETAVVDVTEPFRAHGFLLSWRKSEWQASHLLHDLQNNDAMIREIVEMCALDTHLQIEFDQFANWIEAMCTAVGFDLWSTSMELRPQPHDFCEIVLHAFVCFHWETQDVRGGQSAAVEFISTDWAWRGVVPYVREVRPRNRNSMRRCLEAGFLYVSAPKIGGIFQRSSIQRKKVYLG